MTSGTASPSRAIHGKHGIGLMYRPDSEAARRRARGRHAPAIPVTRIGADAECYH